MCHSREKTRQKGLVALFAAGFLVYGCNNVFMSVLPEYAQAAGLGEGFSGLQSSVFLVCAVVLRLFFGPLADRHGTRPLLLLGTAAFALGGGLLAVCSAAWQILACRVIQSVGLAAFYPCATAAVAASSSPDRTTSTLGAYRLVTSLSLLVAPTSAFALAEGLGHAAAFAFAAALSAPALLLCLGAGTRAPGGTRSCDARSKNSWRPGRLSAQDRGPALAVLGTTAIAAIGYGLVFSFAALWCRTLFPQVNPGITVALMGLGGIGANAAVALAGDRVAKPAQLAASLLSLAAGLAGMGTLAPCSPALLGMCCLACGLGYAGAVTSAIGIAAACGGDRTSTLLSLQQNCIDLGIALGSGAFGLVFEAAGGVCGWPFCLWGAAVLAVCLVALRRQRPYDCRNEE